MRIAVVGAGAIGGLIAGALARSGAEVAVVARGAHLEAIRRHGLAVRSAHLGDFVARVEAAPDLRALGSFDAILVTVKSHQWLPLLEQFAPYAESDTTVATFQNGFPFWYYRDKWLESVDPGGRILRTFAYERLVGGVVHASGNVVEPGVVRHLGQWIFPMGAPAGGESARTRQLAAAFVRAGLVAPVEVEIRRAVWRKLFGNAALNPVSALTRATTQTMLRDPRTRALIRSIVEECRAVAAASGIDVAESLEDRVAYIEGLADVKTSMLQDLEANRPLELEPIVGAVVELAARLRVPVPHLETVYALAKTIEPAG